MNRKLNRRLAVVTGLVVIVIIVVLAVVQGTTGSRTLTVREAASGDFNGQRVQVTGQVVDNSFSLDGQTLVFSIYDADDPGLDLIVRYDGAMSQTFGNQVQAICTGVMADDGSLRCIELVTKCPSKYEGAQDALSLSQLIGYGDAVADVPVKVTGVVVSGSIGVASADVRLEITEPGQAISLPVRYLGGLPDGIGNGTAVVLTGSLGLDGVFTATDIAIKE